MKYLYFFMLASVGFFILVRNSFVLFSDDVRRPCVIHGSFFMYLRDNFFFCKGNAILKALLYMTINVLYASFALSQLCTVVKSVDDRICLNCVIFSGFILRTHLYSDVFSIFCFFA